MVVGFYFFIFHTSPVEFIEKLIEPIGVFIINSDGMGRTV